jgi:hypothetical protein
MMILVNKSTYIILKKNGKVKFSDTEKVASKEDRLLVNISNQLSPNIYTMIEPGKVSIVPTDITIHAVYNPEDVPWSQFFNHHFKCSPKTLPEYCSIYPNILHMFSVDLYDNCGLLGYHLVVDEIHVKEKHSKLKIRKMEKLKEYFQSIGITNISNSVSEYILIKNDEWRFEHDEKDIGKFDYLLVNLRGMDTFILLSKMEYKLLKKVKELNILLGIGGDEKLPEEKDPWTNIHRGIDDAIQYELMETDYLNLYPFLTIFPIIFALEKDYYNIPIDVNLQIVLDEIVNGEPTTVQLTVQNHLLGVGINIYKILLGILRNLYLGKD